MSIFARSSALIDVERTAATRVAVYGLGSVGSMAVLALNKLGVEVVGFDFDEVSAENLGPQLFAAHDIGRSKADAVASNPYLVGQPGTFKKRRVREAMKSARIHILAVDCMDTRKRIVQSAREDDYIIDSRMGATNMRIRAFRVTPESVERWLSDWFPNVEMERLPCTAKATVWNAMLCAGHIGRYVYRWLTMHAPDWEEMVANERFCTIARER
jgi:molybdopterin/thiamine biosynthesis adenylyltransferase